ncbi:MAG: tRNA-intron lyase [Candidatus Bathyarchaeota archaeon]|nr:tRNA-intron lyase [Candidatus Termiticorpusculum sp.]MCL1970496.1 tRNA-intron lyase [Candidatus Termiticorpusculum sp.]
MKVELIDNFLIVWNPKEGSHLYKTAYYGKPLGISKPKIPEFDAPLILDLMEGLYLAETGQVEIIENKKPVSLKTLRKKAMQLYDKFEDKYTVYHDLRTNELIVTPGIKFGCDFAVYKYGPGIEHAPYMISVKPKDSTLSATEIVKAGRLATTVRKRFIIAIPDKDIGNNKKDDNATEDDDNVDGKCCVPVADRDVKYLMFKWFKA